jgi:hypothetical protein
VTDRAHREPAVTLTASHAERIDTELDKHYQRAQRISDSASPYLCYS